MPTSKRAKVVPLTQVKKKGRESRVKLVEQVRSAVESFANAYVIQIDNTRTQHVQEVRRLLKPGRMFQGKNKVLKLALGATPEQEVATNIHSIAKVLTGTRALLFTDAKQEHVQAQHIVSRQTPRLLHRVFDQVQPDEFARSGFCATHTVTLQAGAESLSQFSHSMEPHLRKLGIPTLLKDGVIYLMGDVTVCEKGAALTVNGAQLLKLLGIRMAKFKIRILAVWNKKEGRVETFI